MHEARIIVSAVNNDEVLRANLLRSPDVLNGTAIVFEERGHKSAGRAYNTVVDRIGDGAVVAFIHQDVYLPTNWIQRLTDATAELDQRREPWGVLGVWGVRPSGRFSGRVWCNGGNIEHAASIQGLAEVASIDEIVIVLNNRHGLRFDENLPGFHLYAADIVLQAREKGLKTYVFDAPVVHNSRHNPQVFDRHFFAAYRYMRRKWAWQIPLPTCTVPITRWGVPLYRAWMRREWRRLRHTAQARGRCPDPAALARQLGYEAPAEELAAVP